MDEWKEQAAAAIREFLQTMSMSAITTDDLELLLRDARISLKLPGEADKDSQAQVANLLSRAGVKVMQTPRKEFRKTINAVDFDTAMGDKNALMKWRGLRYAYDRQTEFNPADVADFFAFAELVISIERKGANLVGSRDNFDDAAYINAVVVPALESARSKYTSVNVDEILCFSRLWNAALAQVFFRSPTAPNILENVRKYRRYLDYRRATDFIDKERFREVWKSRAIAEKAIAVICAKGGYDYATGCAAYGLKTGVDYRQISPESVLICGKCGLSHTRPPGSTDKFWFCDDCETPLYRTCPVCGESNPANLLYCARCSRNVKIAAEYNGYVAAARAAISNGNLATAEIAYYNALVADPVKAAELTAIRDKIKK